MNSPQRPGQQRPCFPQPCTDAEASVIALDSNPQVQDHATDAAASAEAPAGGAVPALGLTADVLSMIAPRMTWCWSLHPALLRSIFD